MKNNEKKSFREELESIDKERIGNMNALEAALVERIKNAVRTDVRNHGMSSKGKPRNAKLVLTVTSKEIMHINTDKVSNILSEDLNSVKISVAYPRTAFLDFKNLMNGMMNFMGCYTLTITYTY